MCVLFLALLQLRSTALGWCILSSQGLCSNQVGLTSPSQLPYPVTTNGTNKLSCHTCTIGLEDNPDPVNADPVLLVFAPPGTEHTFNKRSLDEQMPLNDTEPPWRIPEACGIASIRPATRLRCAWPRTRAVNKGDPGGQLLHAVCFLVFSTHCLLLEVLVITLNEPGFQSCLPAPAPPGQAGEHQAAAGETRVSLVTHDVLTDWEKCLYYWCLLNNFLS